MEPNAPHSVSPHHLLLCHPPRGSLCPPPSPLPSLHGASLLLTRAVLSSVTQRLLSSLDIPLPSEGPGAAGSGGGVKETTTCPPPSRAPRLGLDLSLLPSWPPALGERWAEHLPPSLQSSTT